MPYDNPYNRRIARQIDAINDDYAQQHAYSTVNNLSGGIRYKLGNASKQVDKDGYYIVPDLPEAYYDGEGRMEGGSGFARGTFMDTGFEPVEGAGHMRGGGRKKGGTLLGLPQVGGARTKVTKRVPQARKAPRMVIGENPEQQFADMPMLENVIVPPPRQLAQLKRAKRVAQEQKAPRIKMGSGIFSKGLNIASQGADMFGLGKPKKGAGIFSRGLGVASNAADLFGLGKPRRGGNILSRGLNIASDAANMFGLGRKVPVAQMKSVIGGARKPNKRAEIVKRVMQEKNLSMIEASKYVKAHNLY